ncbi:hypothetical protein AOE01nite_35350 [Acetobacter oeni]|uniref:Uncharacterized protein n=1 Tax=Acetobacter oeni TaxID=304077 RepID=A0A511XQS0_9PROT|nr:hypothetical protein AA21952_1795 [Acetobacter oeni LMG 21952]GEN65311.1 hypothetical protein AOE01nite_35350 [Acetobacter oeni]
MDQQILTETVAIITPIGQKGSGVWNRQSHQGLYGFVIRDLPSGQDKAGRTSLIVTSGMDFARKAAA